MFKIYSALRIRVLGGDLLVFLFLFYLNGFNLKAQTSESGKVDVLEYHVSLEPFFSNNYIEGSVSIKFSISAPLEEVIFDSGELIVSSLEGDHIKGFVQEGKKTILSLAPNNTKNYEVTLFYHGSPRRGLVFFNQSQKLYSVYFTSEWMICNAAPDDRASLKLDLLIPENLISVASGVLRDTTEVGNKIKYSWRQDYETPAYTYGFTIGSFNESEEIHGGKLLKYYSEDYTPEELDKIFQYTADMMSFFEEKSGVPFPQNTYAQVLIGHHYQEMSGFAVLKESYGELVLKDSTETNLISHELAHQWWGNMITCESWNHFWLNEGFATFMSAAYNEHRFGKEKYQENIDAYFGVYEKIKAKGGDKSLVFNNWLNPSADDRNLVYFKGAYVLHLLRIELGEEPFWKGIRDYSRVFYGQSVTTRDFQLAMEKSSKKSLESFFDKWVY